MILGNTWGVSPSPVNYSSLSSSLHVKPLLLVGWGPQNCIYLGLSSSLYQLINCFFGSGNSIFISRIVVTTAATHHIPQKGFHSWEGQRNHTRKGHDYGLLLGLRFQSLRREIAFLVAGFSKLRNCDRLRPGILRVSSHNF